jgi:hypothetical protein
MLSGIEKNQDRYYMYQRCPQGAFFCPALPYALFTHCPAMPCPEKSAPKILGPALPCLQGRAGHMVYFNYEHSLKKLRMKNIINTICIYKSNC